MHRLFTIFILLLSIISAHAQTPKPTGGCNTTAYITQISPLALHDTTLINGQAYTLKARLTSSAEPCNAPLSLQLGGLTIGNYPSTTEDGITIALDVFHVAAGTYMLYLCYIDGKDSIAVRVANALSTHDLDNDKPVSLSIYPIPANDILHLKTTNPAETITGIKIINNVGTLMPVPYPGALGTELCVAGLPAGIYLLQVQTTGNIYNEKLVVAH